LLASDESPILAPILGEVIDDPLSASATSISWPPRLRDRLDFATLPKRNPARTSSGARYFAICWRPAMLASGQERILL
jgi:hypothetical protein